MKSCPSQDRIDALRRQAKQLLTKGVNRVAAAGLVDDTLAMAAFSLAQISVEENQADKAIEWLEHEKFGPLTLIKANNPVASRQDFAVETYKMALRAYIAANPQRLKSAEETMAALEERVQASGNAKAAENLTAIYISLGRQLQQHLQELRKAGKQKEMEAVSQAFEVFLNQVLKRGGGGSLASLNWVAETYNSLGSGFDGGGAVSSPKAREYFEKAATAYKSLIAAAEKDPRYQEKPDALLGCDCDWPTVTGARAISTRPTWPWSTC